MLRSMRCWFHLGGAVVSKYIMRFKVHKCSHLKAVVWLKLKIIVVCKFRNISWFSKTHQHCSLDTKTKTLDQDKRGKTVTSQRKPVGKVEFAVELNKSVPRVESHYCCCTTQKKYFYFEQVMILLLVNCIHCTFKNQRSLTCTCISIKVP